MEEYLERIEVGNIIQYLVHNVGDLVATQTNEFDGMLDLHTQHNGSHIERGPKNIKIGKQDNIPRLAYQKYQHHHQE